MTLLSVFITTKRVHYNPLSLESSVGMIAFMHLSFEIFYRFLHYMMLETQQVHLLRSTIVDSVIT